MHSSSPHYTPDRIISNTPSPHKDINGGRTNKNKNYVCVKDLETEQSYVWHKEVIFQESNY